MQYEPIYYLQKYKKNIILWIIFFTVLLAVILYASWQQGIEERRGKIAVYARTVPSDASITINQVVYHQPKFYLKPGKYTATIAKEGFESYDHTLVVNTADPVKIYAGLAPQSEEAKKWQHRHRNDYAQLERESFIHSQEYGESFQKRWPIVSSLPIKDPYFTISYKLADDGSITLTVKGTSPRYREFAIEELRKKGFEPTDYRFEFIGFHNPLQKEAK